MPPANVPREREFAESRQSFGYMENPLSTQLEIEPADESYSSSLPLRSVVAGPPVAARPSIASVRAALGPVSREAKTPIESVRTRSQTIHI